MKLSAKQFELLDAMRKGVRVHFMKGVDPYCFRSDTMKKCTATLFALKDRGLVEEVDSKWSSSKFRVKDESNVPA